MLLGLLLSVAFANPDCDALYAQRGADLAAVEAGMACYQARTTTSATNLEKARNLGRLAYLKFFAAEYHYQSKAPALEESFKLAEEAILLFGKKYDLAAYRALTQEEKTELAWDLYVYGLATSLYVDVRGVAEALRRMDDIKRSMTTIIRIQQEGTVHYGAHRTLGIFHTKVPTIAGGDLNIAKEYLPLAINQTRVNGGMSSYPLNHAVYADLLFKLNKKEEACKELRTVAFLSDDDVVALDNGFTFESIGHVKDARAQFEAKKCP